MTTDTPAPTELDQALRLDVVDLVGRVGTHRHVERSVPAPGDEQIGSLAMTVPTGTDITVEAELESVVEGIYVHGTVSSHLEGECSRCLDPVDQDVTARIGELFMYPEKVPAEEREDTALLEDDEAPLGPLVRDSLAMDAEERPLCRPDCPGLCSQCGFRMEEDPEHEHEVIDDRFAALQGFFANSDVSAEGTDPEPAEGTDADGTNSTDRPGQDA